MQPAPNLPSLTKKLNVPVPMVTEARAHRMVDEALYKAKEEQAIKEKAKQKITQSSQKNSFATGLTLSEEDALRAQIFGCWSVPLGLPYDKDLLVRIKLELKQDGTIMKSEILDHQRMNRPGQKFYKVLAESALRAVRLCQPLKVPPTGYEKWKNIQLNFNPTEMLKG